MEKSKHIYDRSPKNLNNNSNTFNAGNCGGINNFQNNFALNGNNNNNILLNANNQYFSSDINMNNTAINNTTNVFNAINSKQNIPQINSNCVLNSNNNINNTNLNLNNNINSSNNNVNTNILNDQPFNNNFNISNVNNNEINKFKNPFMQAGVGNQISSGSNVNSGYGLASSIYNVNSFIPKSTSNNAFIVDPNKNLKQTGSIFSTNPTNRNKNYYSKFN